MRAVTSHGFLRALPALLLLGCAGDVQGGGSELALEVAPLGLSDLSDARYTVVVRAGGEDGALVWAGNVSSALDGTGDGALWANVPCDAAAGAHSVTLVLDALYDAHGALIAPERYRNPTPVRLTTSCSAEEATPVGFDVTVSQLGRADVLGEAATFGDISCAARVSCEREVDGHDLDLLANPRRQGAPDLTAVLELACTGADKDSTHLYLDDPVIRCEGLDRDVVVDAARVGLVDLESAPSQNPDGYLFAAAVNREVQPGTGVAHWTVALGLDEAMFATAGRCRLLGRASATARALPLVSDGWELPASAVYPVVAWDLELSDGLGRTCGNTEVSDDAGVEVRYAGFGTATHLFVWGSDPVCLRHRFAPSINALSSAEPLH